MILAHFALIIFGWAAHFWPSWFKVDPFSGKEPKGYGETGAPILICRAHTRLVSLVPPTAAYSAQTAIEALGLDSHEIVELADAGTIRGSKAWQQIQAVIVHAWFETCGGAYIELARDHERMEGTGGQENADKIGVSNELQRARAVSLAARMLLDDDARAVYLLELHPVMEYFRAEAEQKAREKRQTHAHLQSLYRKEILVEGRKAMFGKLDEFCAKAKNRQ